MRARVSFLRENCALRVGPVGVGVRRAAPAGRAAGRGAWCVQRGESTAHETKKGHIRYICFAINEKQTWNIMTNKC